MSTTFEATYSVEDNKLRLYASSRLDAAVYQRVREGGFRWAPKQELFVAPAWSPAREDLCLELAGDITAEQTPVIERAEARAQRLDELAGKRGLQANAFHAAAGRIAERFAFGQPILVGHHSEGKARRDQAAMHRSMDKAVQASRAVTYWGNRAEGVERHANRQSAPGVRARRIKTLLAELRDRQRYLNHAHRCAELWSVIAEMDDDQTQHAQALRLANGRLSTGATCAFDTGSALEDGKKDARTVSGEQAASWTAAVHSEIHHRWTTHLLNRLAFERSELGPVARYEAEITAIILQAFAREHGAHKPTATRGVDGHWTLESDVFLPAHPGDGKTLALPDDLWRDLMQACGHEVPEKKARTRKATPRVPIINPTLEEAERLQALWNAHALADRCRYENDRVALVCSMTQTGYSMRAKGTYSPCEMVELDATGRRLWNSYSSRQRAEPVCRVRVLSAGMAPRTAASLIVLTDKPTSALPIAWSVQGQSEQTP